MRSEKVPSHRCCRQGELEDDVVDENCVMLSAWHTSWQYIHDLGIPLGKPDRAAGSERYGVRRRISEMQSQWE